MERGEKVRWIYGSKDNAELSDRYDRWAAEYDADLEEAFGWTGPDRTAEKFARFVAPAARVLDAGAGTGLAGQALASRGFENLVAADLSEGMLAEARKKGVYRGFYKIVLGKTLPFADGAFDAVISVGVLTEGHAPPSSFDELVRVTRPGGHIVFTLRPDLHETGGYKEKQKELADRDKWILLEVGDPFPPLPIGEPDVMHNIWVYRAV